MSQPARAVTAEPSKIFSTSPGKNFEILGSVEVSTPADVAKAIDSARKAYSSWKGLGVSGRVMQLKKLLQVISISLNSVR